MIDQVASIVGGQAELIGEASGLLVGQLGQLGADAFDELIGKVIGCQVGLGGTGGSRQRFPSRA